MGAARRRLVPSRNVRRIGDVRRGRRRLRRRRFNGRCRVDGGGRAIRDRRLLRRRRSRRRDVRGIRGRCDGISSRRIRRGANGEQRERIDVSLWCVRHANAEVDIRLVGVVRDSADDRLPLRDGCAAFHVDRAEMKQRRRIAGRRLDRDGLAPVRDDARERHRSVDRRANGRSGVRTDVDASMLSGAVRVSGVEDEWAQDGAVNRPRPGLGGCGGQRQRAEDDDAESAHGDLLCCPD